MLLSKQIQLSNKNEWLMVFFGIDMKMMVLIVKQMSLKLVNLIN